MSRRRGFTLAELAVYMALVSMAMLLFAGIELSAQRSVRVQGALLDIESQGLRCLGALRRDVEAARSVTVLDQGRELLLQMDDGGAVLYRAGARTELAPDGRQRAREGFGLLVDLRVSQEPSSGRVRVEARFARGEVRRTLLRSALPRRRTRDG